MIDFNTAWIQLKAGIDNAFIQHPFLETWTERHLDEWITLAQEEVEGRRVPHECTRLRVPKPNWMVRQAVIPTHTDNLVYHGIVASFYEAIWEALKDRQGAPDIAHQLREPPAHKGWIASDFRIWKQWRVKSLDLLAGANYVLITDIANYYDNIDVGTLIEDLNALNCPKEEVQLLSDLLNRWSRPRGTGIPQGNPASHVLAKVYMAHMDDVLQREGFLHLRYNDDFRIFCKSALEAKKAIVLLTDTLRDRGLSLQSAKTQIVDRAAAQQEIDGVASTIEGINKEILAELKDLGLEEYATHEEILELLSSNPTSPAPQVIERAFREHFSSSRGTFNKTLFHYLLTRLGRIQSLTAVPFCLNALKSTPEETSHILRYLAAIELSRDALYEIGTLLEDGDTIYDYQKYQITKWAYDFNMDLPQLPSFCRDFALNRNLYHGLRSYAYHLIPQTGTKADSEAIERSYTSDLPDLERADIACAVKNLPPPKLGAFRRRVRDDGLFVKASMDS